MRVVSVTLPSSIGHVQIDPDKHALAGEIGVVERAEAHCGSKPPNSPGTPNFSTRMVRMTVRTAVTTAVTNRVPARGVASTRWRSAVTSPRMPAKSSASAAASTFWALRSSEAFGAGQHRLVAGELLLDARRLLLDAGELVELARLGHRAAAHPRGPGGRGRE